MTGELRIEISPRRVGRALALGALALLLAHVAVQFSVYRLGHDRLWGFVYLFDLDREFNIPTWYSSFLLLICSVLLATIAAARKMQADRYTRHWSVLAVIFLYISLDETASIHELSIEPLRNALHASGLLYFTWIVPGTILVSVFVLSYLGFLAYLPAKTRNCFVIAGALYVGGALGVEAVEGRHADYYGTSNLPFALLVGAEESLEMFGLVTFIYALLAHLRAEVKEVRIHFEGKEPGSLDKEKIRGEPAPDPVQGAQNEAAG